MPLSKETVPNSELSLSRTGYLTKVKEPVSPTIYPLMGKIRWIHAFHNSINHEVKHKQPRHGFEFVSPIPFPTIALSLFLCDLIVSQDGIEHESITSVSIAVKKSSESCVEETPVSYPLQESKRQMFLLKSTWHRSQTLIQ